MLKYMIILRIIAFIILFLGAVFFPWPAVALLAVVFIVAFSWFFEAAAIGLLLGVIYGSAAAGSLNFIFFTASFAAAIFSAEFFKKIIEGENIVSRAVIALIGGITIGILWLVFKLVLKFI